MAIYTKKGDKGKSRVFDSNDLIFKDGQIFATIGTIDELNSVLGVCKSFFSNKQTVKMLEQIQSNLFTIGSILAGAKIKLQRDQVTKLEREIDRMEGTLPVLANFILPGGTKAAGFLHLARSIARRAEREVVEYSRRKQVEPEILVYLNRLSDFLFMLARLENFKRKVTATIWKAN